MFNEVLKLIEGWNWDGFAVCQVWKSHKVGDKYRTTTSPTAALMSSPGFAEKRLLLILSILNINTFNSFLNCSVWCKEKIDLYHKFVRNNVVVLPV